MAYHWINFRDLYGLVNEKSCLHSPYEDYISNRFNTSAQEFEYSLDSNYPVQSPSCVYLTENQFKHHITNTADDTFLLAHFNIRSINRNFDNLRL